MKGAFSGRDQVYAQEVAPAPFVFNEQVARVFPDMITRSVPGYADILQGIGLFARRYVKPSTRVYDLGCSLGAATFEMRHNISVPGVEIIAVDNSSAMTSRLAAAVDQDPSVAPVQVRTESITETELSQASMVVLNFTLQFLAPELRGPLLRRIYEALVPGGILILSEKISYAQPWEQEFLTEIHWDFKRKQGYSDLEIAQKRQALENVLVPWTADEHRGVLAAAGFGQVSQWYGFFQFVSFGAVKEKN